MSSSLLYSTSDPRQYIHSPIDDLFSFFYVGQWAAVHNDEYPTNSQNVHSLRRQLDGTLQSRESATSDIASLTRSDIYTPFIAQSAPILREWKSSLEELKRVWAMVELQAREEKLTGTEASDFFVPQFHKFSLRGVVLYLRLLAKIQDKLEGRM